MGQQRGLRKLRVHERGDVRVDGILRLVEHASAIRPLPAVLETLCEEVAAIVSASVVSVYVREEGFDGDVLVMRANVGFPRAALGSVRLRMGEGITGFAAECLRPISSAIAPKEVRYKPVPGLGEERYPCFLAVPIIRGGHASGVLVLQRPAFEPFESPDVMLATALGAHFIHALACAEARGAPVERRRIGFSRSVRLRGQPVAGGSAIGRARPLPTLEDLVGRDALVPVEQALRVVRRNVGRTARRIAPFLPVRSADTLMALVSLLEDERFRARVIEECERLGVARGLRSVARAYAVTPHQVGAGDRAMAEWLTERAHEVDTLCLLLAARVCRVAPSRAGDALLVSGRVGAFVALTAVARRASAVIVGDAVDEAGLAAEILKAGRVPTVAEVGGLFDWVRPADPLLVDGGRGSVRIHPTPLHVARVRAGL